MDVNTNIGPYLELIECQKRTLKEAKKRQGQRPRDLKPRQTVYEEFMIHRMLKIVHQTNHMMHSSFIPPAYLPCTVSLDELSRVMIRDLQLETHHRGTYMMLRSITPPSAMTAIMTIIEDENSDAIMLHLYQQDDEHCRAATEIVDVGTILMIKEPYFKVMGDGEYGLRVDHLSDIVHLGSDDVKIPKLWLPRISEAEQSAELLKIKGNLAMKENRFWDAIREYSNALKQSATADETIIIKRNRSLAYLRTKHFDAALSDTGFPDFGQNPSEKALFRAAEALYNREQFSECYEVLELLCNKFPSNTLASASLERARNRCIEKTTGAYNFKQLQAQVRKLQPPQLDFATYIGPVEIRQTESTGRGLFVTKPVKAGDLLLCEKAFAYAYVNNDAGDSQSSFKTSLLIHPETNTGFLGAQSDLIKIIVQKLYRNPSTARAFNTLHHGAYEGPTVSVVDGTPIVDTFLVERTMSLNVFGCPDSSLIDHKKISQKHLLLSEKTTEDAHSSCGIWTHASFINHNCISNARRAFIGNMMIVRASRDMEADTEILFWYHPPDILNVENLKDSHKHWGFVCGCAICLDAKVTSSAVLIQRRKLLQDLNRFSQSSRLSQPQLKKVERLLGNLNRTYTQPAEVVPRLLLLDPQLAVASHYQVLNMASKTLEYVGKALASLGFVLQGADLSQKPFTVVRWGIMADVLVEAFLIARTAFTEIGANEDSARAEEYAKTSCKIIVGEDESFMTTYR